MCQVGYVIITKICRLMYDRSWDSLWQVQIMYAGVPDYTARIIAVISTLL